MSDWDIQPFSKALNRSEFDCGVYVLNMYLQRQASQDIKRKACAIYVSTLSGSDDIIGYYTINACSARFQQLPEDVIKKLPRYPEIPAFLIGRLAVSQNTRGTGLGKVLLINALLRCLHLSDEVGAALVLVDAKDENAAAFYRHFQFQELDKNRMFLPLSVVAKLTED